MINPEAIALNNILSHFENKYYSKREAAEIVGGRKKLESLIEANKIEAVKNNPTQKGKWYCNAAQVLRHCRIKKDRRPNRSTQKKQRLTTDIVIKGSVV